MGGKQSSGVKGGTRYYKGGKGGGKDLRGEGGKGGQRSWGAGGGAKTLGETWGNRSWGGGGGGRGEKILERKMEKISGGKTP